MDDFLNQFLSSSSWSDANLTERSSWVGNGPGETNGLLSNSMRAFEGEETNSPANMINTSHVIESLLAQNTSMLGGRQSSYAMGKSLLNGESKLQKEGPICDSETSLLECVNGNMKPGYMDLQLDTPMSTKCAPNHDPSELLPAAVALVKSPSLHPESGSVGSNDSEQSEFQPTLRDSHSLTSVPQLWHPSYGSASSLSSIIMQDELKGYDLQGQYLDHGTAVLGNEYLGDEKFPRSNLYASLALPINGQDELNGHCLSSAARHYIPLGRAADLHSHSQLPHVPSTPGGNCSGTAKPRVRARRGQATDPHSIAERLRREKIAERMKNLQELVPNSNKTDKASMLDEIIEYVKFLQLQVKVLSMSRLGAAGAVVPLITDVQAEGSGGLLVSRSTGEGADPPFVSPDDLAFEQEVVKLMESSMTTAMQFLQSKGVCLMPIALASAISGRKVSSPCTISSEKKKSILTTGIGHPNNGSSNTTTVQKSSGGVEIVTKENVAGTCSRQHISITGCNGATNVVIKQEEVKNTECTTTTRETQPEHN